VGSVSSRRLRGLRDSVGSPDQGDGRFLLVFMKIEIEI
jgi:hypothetical protein